MSGFSAATAGVACWCEGGRGEARSRRDACWVGTEGRAAALPMRASPMTIVGRPLTRPSPRRTHRASQLDVEALRAAAEEPDAGPTRRGSSLTGAQTARADCSGGSSFRRREGAKRDKVTAPSLLTKLDDLEVRGGRELQGGRAVMHRIVGGRQRASCLWQWPDPLPRPNPDPNANPTQTPLKTRRPSYHGARRMSCRGASGHPRLPKGLESVLG